MKRSLLIGILGITTAFTATTSFGQGGIYVGNYQGAYNPVVWSAASGGGFVHSTDGVNLTLWWGQGSGLTDNQLTFSEPLQFDLVNESNGYPGYYSYTLVTIPGWVAGQNWTFQVRASGNSVRGPVDTLLSRSALWVENSNIKNIGTIPPVPPGVSTVSMGLTVYVPEPSSFALVGLSLAGFGFLRRRGGR